jgi:hypothetical protein
MILFIRPPPPSNFSLSFHFNVGRGLAPAGHFVKQNAVPQAQFDYFHSKNPKNVPFFGGGSKPLPYNVSRKQPDKLQFIHNLNCTHLFMRDSL